MKPWIDGNEEIKYVFDTAFAKLHVDFGLSLEDAEALVRRYLALFTDEEFCRATRAPLHDADFFTHEGGLNLAIRMFWCLHVNPNSQDNGHAAFIKWRTPYQKEEQARIQALSREDLYEIRRRHDAAQNYLRGRP